MTKWQLNLRSKLDGLILLLLAALMVSFFLHFRVNGFITMLIIIMGVFRYVVQVKPLHKIGFILLMPALFLMLVFGQLYTSNMAVGWTLVERSLSVLLLPIALISYGQIGLKREKLLIWTFIGAGFVASAYCLGHQIVETLEAGSFYTEENTTHFLFNRFMHHRLSAPLQLHAIYFSLYIAFMVAYLFDLFLSSKKKVLTKVSLAVLITFFLVIIYLLKSAIIAFALAVVLVYILWNRIGNAKAFYGFTAVALALAFYMVKSKMEFIDLDYDMSDPGMGMLAIRLSIWENALYVIQNNWLLGTGTGDADVALLNAYKINGFEMGFEKDYNCHNMYLQYWLGNGIAALGLFVAYFILLLKKAIKHKNAVFVGFLILFALFSFTESTMRVQKGMVFFMVFSTLFYFNPSLWANHQNSK